MSSWTVGDLAKLEKALGTGALKVRFADGREVTYRSLAEMRSILDEMRTALGQGSGQPRTTLAAYCRD